MKKTILIILLLGGMLNVEAQTLDLEKNTPMVQQEVLNLTQIWDKVFPKSNKVDHQKVTFVNRYGITLAADMYVPKGKQGKLSAIAVSGPFGAVKEQSSGLYAQTLAERGFLTIAFDPSFTGESGGQPRNIASPDINTEDFSAAVDFLSTNPLVDPERIGLLGICGWGGIALNDAAMDTRVKATVVSTMYDMTRIAANGYNDSDDNPDSRYQRLVELNTQRTKDYQQGYYERGGTTSKPQDVPQSAPQFAHDYSAYYSTERGYHQRANNSFGGWNKTMVLPFINLPFLKRSNEIRSAVLLVHGDKAHSYYFSEGAYKDMMQSGQSVAAKASNKEFYTVKGANHVDLYDRTDIIPFDKIEQFYRTYLK